MSRITHEDIDQVSQESINSEYPEEAGAWIMMQLNMIGHLLVEIRDQGERK